MPVSLPPRPGGFPRRQPSRRTIRADGAAILLVEQNAATALHLASRGHLLETGVCVIEDKIRALITDDYVRKADLVSCPIGLAQLALNQWGEQATVNKAIVPCVSAAPATHFQ